jgi:hypothetical protein
MSAPLPFRLTVRHGTVTTLLCWTRNRTPEVSIPTRNADEHGPLSRPTARPNGSSCELGKRIAYASVTLAEWNR